MATSPLKAVNTRIKAIRKAHPKMTFKAAQLQAWKEYRAGKISGAPKKKKAVAAKPRAAAKRRVGAVKAAPKKKTVIRTERLTTIGRAPKKSTAVGGESRGAALLRKMDSLQKKVAAAKTKDAKDFYKVAYNTTYDKLTALKKQMRV